MKAIILIWISSVDNLENSLESASTEPSTSPLRMMFNSLNCPNAIRRPISAKVIWRCVLTDCSRINCKRFVAICFASLSSSNTLNLSPAVDAPSKPKIDIGVDGKIFRNSKIRIIREGVVVFTGELATLKRFKDDVKDVAKGYDCGMQIKNYNDIEQLDIIEAFQEVEVKKKMK